MMLIQKRI